MPRKKKTDVTPEPPPPPSQSTTSTPNTSNPNTSTSSISDVKLLQRDNLISKHPYRQNVYKKLFELLNTNNKEPYNYSLDDIQKFALNIERGIFNYAVSNSSSKEWDFIFKHYYTTKAVRIYTNLNPDSYIKNTELIHRFFRKEFTEFELAYFDSEKLFPSRYYELMEMYKDKSKPYVKPEVTNDGAHFCGKCKTYKTTYYQLQTRSAKIIGWKSTLLITSWLCYWKNSCSPSLILRC